MATKTACRQYIMPNTGVEVLSGVSAGGFENANLFRQRCSGQVGSESGSIADVLDEPRGSVCEECFYQDLLADPCCCHCERLSWWTRLNTWKVHATNLEPFELYIKRLGAGRQAKHTSVQVLQGGRGSFEVPGQTRLPRPFAVSSVLVCTNIRLVQISCLP